MPAEWQQHDSAADFDVIATALDQMQAAITAGDYELAESARLEAYAILESGPEAKLIVFAPQHKAPLEDLFWYGQGDHKGLAYLIGQRAPAAEITASRKALDAELAAAQAALVGNNAPVSVASNAAIIVFREGLEAVLILASLMGSLKLGEQRRFRRPLWWGAAGALLASALTWLLARGLLSSLARYGERLEAIVSLIAIGVLLLITNWFFHKVYWNGWIANFHTKKRKLIGGSVGQWLGLALLGFTSIYREGFETVLFLQALVLEAGAGVVLSGVALGLGGTLLVGFIVFALQAKLPYKKMLIVTGVMIGVVLLQMVGNTDPCHAGGRMDVDPPDPLAGAALLGRHVVRALCYLGRHRPPDRRGGVRDRQLSAGRAHAASPGQTATRERRECGRATGVAILIVAAVLMLALGVKLPLRPFFRVAGLLVYYLGFKFVGAGLHSLQVAGVIPSTPIAGLSSNPIFEFFGIYPTWQTLLPQLALLLGALAVWMLLRASERRAGRLGAGAAA